MISRIQKVVHIDVGNSPPFERIQFIVMLNHDTVVQPDEVNGCSTCPTRQWEEVLSEVAYTHPIGSTMRYISIERGY